jgi:hypothetical protein
MRRAATTSISRQTLARLSPQIGLSAAVAQANTTLAEPRDQSRAPIIGLESYSALLTRSVRPALLVLQAASALLLFLVCVNVGWLFSARARRLQPAFDTMTALGAAPADVVRTHVVSAVFVALVAGPCAVAIAWVLVRFGVTLESGVFSRTAEPAITVHVLAMAFAATVAANLLA